MKRRGNSFRNPLIPLTRLAEAFISFPPFNTRQINRKHRLFPEKRMIVAIVVIVAQPEKKE